MSVLSYGQGFECIYSGFSVQSGRITVQQILKKIIKFSKDLVNHQRANLPMFPIFRKTFLIYTDFDPLEEMKRMKAEGEVEEESSKIKLVFISAFWKNPTALCSL